MKVRVLVNYQDKQRRVHLVNDVLDILDSDFNKQFHSEDVTTKRKTTRGRKKTNITELDGVD